MNQNNSSLFNIESHSSNTEDIRILVVDDQHFARMFLEQVLDTVREQSTSFKVVGTADDGQQALRQVESLNPDVVLIDLEMPEMDGVSATKIISQKFPKCKVLVLSSYDGSSYIHNALQAGAKGYLLKDTPAAEIRNAIISVYKGYYQVGPGLLAKALDSDIQKSNIAAVSLGNPSSLAVKEVKAKPESKWSNLAHKLKLRTTLPQVGNKGLIYLSLVLIAVGLPWTILAKVNETSQATGKIEPQGKTMRIDAPVGGKVTEILTQEGQAVKKGQKLLKIESKAVLSELNQQAEKLKGQENQLAQLKLLKDKHLQTLEARRKLNQAQEQEKQAQLEQVRESVDSADEMYALREQEKQAQLEQAQRAIKTSEAAYELAKIRASSSAAKIPRHRQAFKNGGISQDRLTEAILAVQEAEKESERAGFELEQLKSNLQEIQSSYTTLVEEQTGENRQAELRLSEQQGGYDSVLQKNNLALLGSDEKLKNTEAQIASLVGEIAQTKSKIGSLKFQLTQYTIEAPMTGTVFEFPIQNAETAVESGETVAMITQVKNSLYPESDLILRAKMPSSETALIRKGLPAIVKLDAYPFEDYGTVEGHVSSISPGYKKVSSPQSSKSSEENEFFELEISIDHPYLETANKQIAINPGQTATAEIVLRKRRLIDYFLEPFKK